jgi:ABC-type transporter Mla subunit MlaD
MTPDQVNLMVAIAAAVTLGAIAVAALIVAIGLWRISRDLRGLSRSAGEALNVVNIELPATLKELRHAAANLNRVSAELQPRVERVDALFNEADASLKSLRATLEAAEDIVRGPAAALERVQRTVGAAGEGLVRGADRLRRTVQDRRPR